MSERAPAQGAAQLPSDAQTETLGVAFFDLSRIGEWVSSEEDERIARFFQSFYTEAARHIEEAGGRIVKYIGDAGLAVFPMDAAEACIFALCDFSPEARENAAQFGLDTHLNVNIHAGPVISGSFGPPGSERYDVIGKTVNIAARLGRRGITLSAQAFRCLGPEARKKFKKHTPPVTYRHRG